MTERSGTDVPQTLEGWYVLHDVYALDWAAWRALDEHRKGEIAGQAARWLDSAAGGEGDSALYSVLTQKGDLMLVHYRRSPDDLNRAELGLRQLQLYDYLLPAYSYFSVIELGLYELTAIANKKLADQGVTPGTDAFDEAFAREMDKQKQRAVDRLWCDIPAHRYICFYPMDKRRGEHVNWYALSLEERRDLMRAHGRIGQQYRGQVKQIISGSVGLDDWEWGVSLHADDVLPFKKLIYEMRFDPASAKYAEFGPFYIGIRTPPDQLPALLAGRLT
ncbi:MAG TPA: hydrogen peroxide-dependent heme synthase [Phycisphaerae bacterium]|nr:hydrogen peroxide-dependent heme synthase [Phycisphaerae bacterium]